jgi:hypothetical protein
VLALAIYRQRPHDDPLRLADDHILSEGVGGAVVVARQRGAQRGVACVVVQAERSEVKILAAAVEVDVQRTVSVISALPAQGLGVGR